MGRFLAAMLFLAMAAACQNETHAVFSPVPSPTPHLPATAAILQANETPAGLVACPGSGPVEVYLAVLGTKDATVAARANDAWVTLLTEGARDGAMAVYATSPAVCAEEFGATTRVRAIASFVARFGDQTEADLAWQAGVFGFVPPPPGQLTSGVTVGSSTGLGTDSFTYERPSVRLASWRHGVYVAMIVSSNLDLSTFRAATAAVDARLN